VTFVTSPGDGHGTPVVIFRNSRVFLPIPRCEVSSGFWSASCHSTGVTERANTTLKITIDDGPATLTMKLEGRIAGPWTSALEESWNSLRQSDRRRFVVDLCGVTHVDAAGRHILAAMHRQSGARFLADTPLTKYFAEEAIRQGTTNSKGNPTGKRGG